MAFRIGRQTFSSAIRTSLRSTVSQGNARATTRRTMSSSSSHSAKPSSDTPWIIGSGLIFGPALVYLLSPYSTKPAHHEHHESHSSSDAHAHAPAANSHEADEPVQKGEDSTGDDQPPSSSGSMTDDEGTEVSAEEVNVSMAQAFAADSPKDAQNAEANSPLSGTDSLSQSSNVEQKQVQEDTQKTSSKDASVPEKKDKGPTDISEAS